MSVLPTSCGSNLQLGSVSGSQDTLLTGTAVVLPWYRLRPDGRRDAERARAGYRHCGGSAAGWFAALLLVTTVQLVVAPLAADHRFRTVRDPQVFTAVLRAIPTHGSGLDAGSPVRHLACGSTRRGRP
jgi:hypothetical protein